MALIDLPETLAYPVHPGTVTAAPSRPTITRNNIGEKFAVVLQSPVTDTITKVLVPCGAINAGDIDVRIETVSLTTGYPSGTLWSTTTNKVHTLAGTEDNVHVEVTLTSAASVSAGDLLAIVIDMVSASMGSFGSQFTNWEDTGSFPHSCTYTSSAWSRQATSSGIGVVFGTAGYTQVKGLIPSNGVTSAGFSSSTTPDCRGNAFNLPFKCKVSGCWVLADWDGDTDINLYDSDGATIIATTFNDSEIPGAGTGYTVNHYLFDNEPTLTAGSTYYLVVEPTTTTSLTLPSINFDSTNLKKIFYGSGIQYCTAKDPTGVGSWTLTDTSMAPMGLYISSIDDGAGGGGGTVNLLRGKL